MKNNYRGNIETCYVQRNKDKEDSRLQIKDNISYKIVY